MLYVDMLMIAGLGFHKYDSHCTPQQMFSHLNTLDCNLDDYFDLKPIKTAIMFRAKQLSIIY